MIKEHDRVVLLKDLPKERLQKDDVGTVIHVHHQGEAFEVEFLTLNGETAAVAIISSSDVRSVGPRDIIHVRQLAAT